MAFFKVIEKPVNPFFLFKFQFNFLKNREKIIPLYPYFRLESIFSSKQKKYDIPGILDAGNIYSTLNARSALEICLKSAGVEPGDEVLLPAYLCPVAVYAVTKLSIIPVFYQIGWNCEANIGDIRSKISKNTRVVLSVHYFGFPSNIEEVKAICDQYSLLLIEDCAHCFFGTVSGFPVGSLGDFAIASFYKFFPSVHGGFLRVNSPERLVNDIIVKAGSIGFQLKSALDALEIGVETGNVNFLRKKAFACKEFLWDMIKSKLSRHDKDNSKTGPDNSDSNNPYSVKVIHDTYSDIELPVFSKMISKISDKNRMILVRRRNYGFLLEALSRIEGCEPLFSMLPGHVVPYNFPLVSQKADILTDALRNRGVKVARFAGYLWEGIDESLCPVSVFLFTTLYTITGSPVPWA